VTIRCSIQADPTGAVFLKVIDNGPGIAPQERSRALERFYWVPGTQGEGNGLGLAIANEIARVHKTQLLLTDASPGLPAPCGLRICLAFPQENPHFIA
jgi:two-component system sensor histidine kinase TctE